MKFSLSGLPSSLLFTAVQMGDEVFPFGFAFVCPNANEDEKRSLLL